MRNARTRVLAAYCLFLLVGMSGLVWLGAMMNIAASGELARSRVRADADAAMRYVTAQMNAAASYAVFIQQAYEAGGASMAAKEMSTALRGCPYLVQAIYMVRDGSVYSVQKVGDALIGTLAPVWQARWAENAPEFAALQEAVADGPLWLATGPTASFAVGEALYAAPIRDGNGAAVGVQCMSLRLAPILAEMAGGTVEHMLMDVQKGVALSAVSAEGPSFELSLYFAGAPQRLNAALAEEPALLRVGRARYAAQAHGLLPGVALLSATETAGRYAARPVTDLPFLAAAGAYVLLAAAGACYIHARFPLGPMRLLREGMRRFGDASSPDGAAQGAEADAGRMPARGRSEGALLLMAMEVSEDALLCVDLLNGRVVLSESFYQWFGLPRDAAYTLNELLERILEAEDAARLITRSGDIARGALPCYTQELRVRLADGRTGWMCARLRAFPGETGEAGFLAGAFLDITSRRETQDQLERKAYLYDWLTGLPNRACLFERAGAVVRQAMVQGTQGAMVFVDIDNFKEINDTFGHAVGDEVLVALGARLRKAVRDTDLVARVGGDEFVVLAENTPGRAAVETLAQRLLCAFHEPFLVNRTLRHVSASIGIAVFPQDGRDVSELMRKSDWAMYCVKRAGKGGYTLFADVPPQDQT